MKNLLAQNELENSSVVANSLMNRERGFQGGNSYEKELSFPIFNFLKKRIETEGTVFWLDLCCGQGNALIEAAKLFKQQNFHKHIEIVGIDLAGMFAPKPLELAFLKLLETPFENFKFPSDCDLITCAHGLHYIGDKLGFIEKAAKNLKKDGVFLANLDAENLKFANEKVAAQTFIKTFRRQGFEFQTKKHLLTCKGKKEIKFGFKYLGADDRAGANYTKQPVVNSYYQP